MDKMDNFINKKLKDYTPADDGWNIPSDKMWDAAKPHFPKKEEPKKRGFFFIFPLGIVIGIALMISILNYNNDKSIALSQKAIKNSNINQTLSSDSYNNVESKIPIKNIESIIINESEKQTNKNTPTTEKVVTTKISSNSNEDNSLRLTPAKSNNSKRIITHEKVTHLNSNNSNNSNSDTRHSASLLTEKKEKTQSKVEQINVKLPIPENLNSKKTSFLNYNNNETVITPTLAPLIKPRSHYRAYPQSEIGISKMFYPVSLILNDAEGDKVHPDDISTLNGSFHNANITTSKWFAKKWSISSGIYYTRINLDINFSVWDTVVTELTDLIDAQYQKSVQDNINSNRDNELSITVFDGFGLDEGDLVNLRADVNLQIEAFEVPFILNYHFYKRKFEYSLGAGTALGYYIIDQSPIDLEVYKNNDFVAIASQAADMDSEFALSFYTVAGLKYNITPNINFGLAMRVCIDDLIYSGAEVGLSYRWNRGM